MFFLWNNTAAAVAFKNYANHFATTVATKPNPAYVIRKLTLEDKEGVLNLVAKYWPKEPLNKAAGLMADGVMTEEIARPIVRALPQQLSYGAFDRSGDIVGVAVCNLLRRNENQFDNTESEDPASRRINLLLNEFERRANFWSHVTADAVAYNILTLVDEQWHSQAIGGNIVGTLVGENKKLGVAGFRADCSSYYAQVALRRLRARLLCSLPYTALQAPCPPHPHTHLEMYYLQ